MEDEHQTLISGLIFKELIKRGYSIEDGKRVWNVADSKLWYLKPDQAQSYLDVLDSAEYGSGFAPKEKTMISKYIEEICNHFNDAPTNIIDLGCGDGRKAIQFIEAIGKKQRVRYCPVDISAYMVKKAIEKISRMDVEEVIESKWNISDFENLENVTALLTTKEYRKNLYLLLGNTLSNFDFHDLLYQIRGSMKGGDYILIGNGIEETQVEEKLLRFFENPNWDNFFSKILLQLGFNRKDIKLGARFKNSRLEWYYNILNDHTITLSDKSVKINKGEKIIVAVSYHYTQKEVQDYLKLYFEEVDLKISEDKKYVLALCKK